MTTVVDTFGCMNTDPGFANLQGFHASLECEIECILSPYGEKKKVGPFTCKADNSLRNSGWEYITNKPSTREQLIKDFTWLQNTLKFEDFPEGPFSHRTSVHVHVNCMGLETESVRNIILLYALFEDFFFSMAKPNRKDNIHCVALTDTYLPAHYKHDMVKLYGNWHKYTALNACRLRDLGTLEFRHLHGTGDPVELNQWLSALQYLWEVGQQIKVDSTFLTSKVMIVMAFRSIFAGNEKVLALEPSLFDIIKNTLIDVKMSTIKD